MRKITLTKNDSIVVLFLAAATALIFIFASSSCKNGTKSSNADSASTDKIYVGSGKDSFHITGFVEGLKDRNIYLGTSDENGQQKNDSVFVTDGHFHFAGKVSEPHMAAFMLNDGLTSVPFVIDNLDYTVTGKTDTIHGFILDIKGSPIQEDYKTAKALTKDLWAKSIDRNVAAYDAELKKDFANAKRMQAERDSIDAEISAITRKYISDHPNKMVSLFLFEDALLDVQDTDSALVAFKKFYPDLKNTIAGKRIGNMLEAMVRTAIGKEATEVQQNDIAGKPVKLSDFRGKYVLLDFWASWCSPCRAENPNVLKAYNKFKDKNFTVLGVSLDENGDNWKKAVKEDKMPWVQTSDLKGFSSPAARAYGVRAIPSNFLIDPAGKIIAKDLREGDLMQKLSEVIK